MALIFAAPVLPIYSPARAWVFRGVRWAWLAAILVLAAWPDVLKQSWWVGACAWSIVWVEATLFSLRRKLPVAQWPKQLFL